MGRQIPGPVSGRRRFFHRQVFGTPESDRSVATAWRAWDADVCRFRNLCDGNSQFACRCPLGLQDDILNMPCLALNFIGRVETFTRDIVRVLDQVRADQQLRQAAVMPLRASPHQSWPLYYTQNLADRVYRAYERDFDRFGYPRAISATPAIFSGANV